MTRPSRFALSSDQGDAAAVLIVFCAAAVFFVAHGLVTQWDLAGNNWDARHYFAIASHGYPAISSVLDNGYAGFLPGYPLLLAPAAHLFPQEAFLASFITSTLLSSLGAICLLRVLRQRLELQTALAGIALLAFSPFAIYLYNGYSEVALFAGAMLVLYLLQRGRFLLAAAIAGYALICRPHAIALLPLFVPHGWRLLRSGNWFELGAMVALWALPGLVYGFWMLHLYGDPFALSKTLTLWGRFENIGHAWPLPVRAGYSAWLSFGYNGPNAWALCLCAWLLALVATLAGARHLPCTLVVYGLCVLLFIWFTTGLVPTNLGRHSLMVFTTGPAIATGLVPRSSDSLMVRCAAWGAFAAALVSFSAIFIVMTVRFSFGQWVS